MAAGRLGSSAAAAAAAALVIHCAQGKLAMARAAPSPKRGTVVPIARIKIPLLSSQGRRLPPEKRQPQQILVTVYKRQRR